MKGVALSSFVLLKYSNIQDLTLSTLFINVQKMEIY